MPPEGRPSVVIVSEFLPYDQESALWLQYDWQVMPFSASHFEWLLTCLTRMKAVFIGIDNYSDPGIKRLTRAVFDAERMRRLCIDYGMLPRNAVTLHDGAATRQAILKQILALSEDKEIEKGDPILIYFAGHGGEVEAKSLFPTEPGGTVVPATWSTERESDSPGGMVQMILPWDFINDNRSEQNGELRGQGILDFVLGEYVGELARKKGNNITVILDSCHSGSGCRDMNHPGETDSSIRVRGTTLSLHHKAYGLNRRLTGTLDDYVLLAACAPDQKAYEGQSGGYFTSALVDGLKESIMTSPRNLVENMAVILSEGKQQLPRCEGVYSVRLLFSIMENHTRLRVVVEALRDIHGQPIQSVIVLEAGEESGVEEGSEYKVYADIQLNDFLGHFVVSSKQFGVGRSILIPRPGDPTVQRAFREGYAIRCMGHPLSLYSSSFPTWFQHHILKINQDPASLVKVDLHPIPAEHPPAGVYVSSFEHGQGIDFKITDYVGSSTSSRHITGRFCTFLHDTFPESVPDPKVDSSRLPHVLASAAKFYWHLNRQPSTISPGTISRSVTLECFTLRETDVFWQPYEPEGQNLVRTVADRRHDQLIDIVADPNQAYGFNITNTSPVSLWCGLFFFDLEKLEITELYHPVITAKPTGNYQTDGGAYVLPGKCVPIGYGSSARRPICFSIPNGKEIDIGYLLLYVSTKAVNLQHIRMPSPFDVENVETGKAIPRGPILIGPRPDCWDFKKIPLIVRK
ncbi:hypothetical protein D9758_016674 [Tetrapyrgos nigripes]|uniref:Peptidase C14 caspase domain-containing protein n=1 Tax=Tetrapyrgos nigripes TaxID=182062 RepID=A0A8H5CA62_9AGAR|nr:hypothetical protein D9758_016674 [Tetrapyrgos nigripes]